MLYKHINCKITQKTAQYKTMQYNIMQYSVLSTMPGQQAQRVAIVGVTCGHLGFDWL